MECIPRVATSDDLSVCRGFDRDLPDEMLERRLAAGEIVVAESDHEPVGYLRLEHLWAKIPYIGLILVREPLRGRGIGTAMLSFVEQSLRQAGHIALYSSSQADEPAPQAWHRRSGFVECGIITGINDGGIGEIFFRKPLA